MKPHRTIELWFDFSSNYCYPTIMRVESLAALHGVAVQWRPFLLGPVFKAIGWSSSPLFLHEAKSRYVWRDMYRRAERFGLPFVQPSVFPRRTLLPMRIATLASESSWIGEFCRLSMLAHFGANRDIDTHEAMQGILDHLVLPSAGLIADAESETNKALLRRRTQQAMVRGVFGAPMIFVGQEMFWGDDRLEDALEWATR
jgi:2-hydroxychromene-2-carboxylate isomerase